MGRVGRTPTPAPRVAARRRQIGAEKASEVKGQPVVGIGEAMAARLAAFLRR